MKPFQNKQLCVVSYLNNLTTPSSFCYNIQIKNTFAEYPKMSLPFLAERKNEKKKMKGEKKRERKVERTAGKIAIAITFK